MRERTDVLIVGAGPTGLALSISLCQSGVDHRLVDKLAEGQNTSRAAVIHAQTLEALERLGVAQALAEQGLKLVKVGVRERDQVLLSLRFDDLPSTYPYLLLLPQHETERLFTERIAALGGSIRRGVSAHSVVQDAAGAEVTLVETGLRTSVAARYVVGADGMQSVVREAAGIEFEGAAYDASFVLADCRLDWPLGREEVSLFSSPDGLLLVAPFPDGLFRIVATLDDAPAAPDVADVQALLDRRGPFRERGKVLEVVWSSRFRIHHRLARTYRNGGLFLVGDAAHVHSPAGGQGMNTGLVDAVVLGGLLADVVKGRRPETDLDLYETLRRPAASQVLALADRLTRIGTVRGLIPRLARNIVLSAVDRTPLAKRFLKMSVSGLSRAARSRLPA